MEQSVAAGQLSKNSCMPIWVILLLFKSALHNLMYTNACVYAVPNKNLNLCVLTSPVAQLLFTCLVNYLSDSVHLISGSLESSHLMKCKLLSSINH